MKLHIGTLPNKTGSTPDQDKWKRINSPSSRLSYFFAGLFGMVTLFFLFTGLVITSFIASGNDVVETAVNENTPWGVVIVTFLLFIPLHEFLHIIWYPKLGFTAQTTVVIWPKKLRFGVYYDGCISRSLWLMMRLTPLLVLSIIPAFLLMIFHFVLVPYTLLIFLQVIMLVNAIGSGGDIAAVMLVIRQVPTKAQICFFDGKAYWGFPPQ